MGRIPSLRRFLATDDVEMPKRLAIALSKSVPSKAILLADQNFSGNINTHYIHGIPL
jgi:hypothetical protein